MKRIGIFLPIFVLVAHMSFAQNSGSLMMTEIPYKEIGEAPQEYSAATVAARMIDGLGYRYYWATEGLRAEDLDFKPSDDARNMKETLEHLYGLSSTILNASKNAPNVRPSGSTPQDFVALRQQTLQNLEMASKLLKKNPGQDLEDLKIIFQRGGNSSEFPYWNMLNGPIADAIYHTGQIVSFRRTAGNPMNPKVNVFMGKTRE